MQKKSMLQIAFCTAGMTLMVLAAGCRPKETAQSAAPAPSTATAAGKTAQSPDDASQSTIPKGMEGVMKR